MRAPPIPSTLVPAVLLAALLPIAGAAAETPPSTASSRNVRATLLSEMDSIQPGRPFWLGLRLQTAPGWHVYWKQPGDSGLPPRLKWTLPAAFEAEGIQFPYPQRFSVGELTNYGYTGDVLLLVPVKAPASVGAGTVQLTTNATWLECREACIPARATLGLELPVRSAAPRPQPGTAALFSATRQRLPAPARGWRFQARADRIVLRPPASWRAPQGPVEFFCSQDNVILFGAPSRVVAGPRGWGLEMLRDPNGAVPATLQGVLVVRRGGQTEAIEIEAAAVNESMGMS